MKILIAGDYCPQLRVADLIEREKFSCIFSEVRGLIEDNDYSIVNLECPVTRSDEKPIQKVGPNLQCSERGIKALKWSGFNCITLANNHFYDFGEDGVKRTMDVCKEYEIDIVGGGTNLDEADQTLFKQINGQTIAIINCCEHEFSVASNNNGGSNPLNPIHQYHKIHEAREIADYVLVIVHGGNEHYQLPSPRMVETYHFFIDAGADAVVNHHQHCFSGYEYYNGKPIFYGLGNFCFDNNNNTLSTWHEGFMVSIDFSKNGITAHLFPYHQCYQDAAIVMLRDEERMAFNERINSLSAIILNSDDLYDKYEQFMDESVYLIKEVFEPYHGRIASGLLHRNLIPSFINDEKKRLILSFLQCESQIPKVFHYLKKRK